jgi:hypothetical protein
MAWTTPGTAVAGDVLTAAFWNSNVRDNMIELAPIANAWTNFTPTLTNMTAGNGVHASRYLKVGRTVLVNYSFTFGTTTTISGAPVFTLPPGITADGPLLATQCEFLDSGTARYLGIVEADGNTQVVCQAISTTGSYAVQTAPSATVPFTWTVNDRILVGIIYVSTS